MTLKTLLFLCGTATSCLAAEQATYNIAGGLTSLIANGVEMPVKGGFVVSFTGGVSASMQPHEQHAQVTRDGLRLSWKGSNSYSNGSKSQFTADWTESDMGVALNGSVSADAPFSGARAFGFVLDTESVDYVIDLPRASFAGGRIEPSGGGIPPMQPGDPTFFRGSVDHVALVDAQGNWRLTLALDRARPVSVTDLWDSEAGRVYRVRIQLHAGSWQIDDPLKLGLTLKLAGVPHAMAANLSVNVAAPRYPFDGFGGNFRVYQETPIVAYSLDNLQVSWARIDFNALAWDHDRSAPTPGPSLLRTFALMQRMQQEKRPWILSLWFLPERFYTDPNQRPFGTFNRRIAPDRWPEFLDLLGSYLQYIKSHYGAEPDLFSFNEPDLGVSIGFTGETHRDAIKRIGAHLASLGLKTRLLLGDTANPRDSHLFALPAAADPEALRYIGAVSFHSWGNGTPEQYAAWGDLAEWVHRPLLVAEAGVDPGAFQNSVFDSYAYGLKEARQFQELLRYARPQTLIYWQFTDDYGLVHVGPNNTIEPTPRFWLMKQFVNLTPVKSQAVTSSSDQSDVLVSAFSRGNAVVVHVLNLGADRDAAIAGLPSGTWRTVTTTETAGYQEAAAAVGGARGPNVLHLPARSMTTLIRKE
jgi:O-glycosyl hydrolase